LLSLSSTKTAPPREPVNVRLWLLVLSVLCAGPAGGAGEAARSLFGEGVQLECAQPRPDALECDYRLFQPAALQAVSASVGDVELPAPELLPRRGTTAVLFLIDTSDPAREAVVRRNAEHVRRLLQARREHHDFGLAVFDTDLRVLAPLGSGPERIREALEGVRAVGPTTELYRSTLEAVQRLAEYPAERRGLLLFSDGLAEDRAYFHEDVIRTAHEGDVIIYGLGYARSPSLRVALQTLRRLAEETGGRFIAADEQHRLPAGFLEQPYRTLDNGGRLRLGLAPAIDAGMTGEQMLELAWITAEGSASARLPVSLPPAARAPTPDPAPPPPAEPATPPPAAAPPEANEGAGAVEPRSPRPPESAAPGTPASPGATPSAGWQRLLWPVIAALALVLAALALVLAWRRARPAPAKAASTPLAAGPSDAYLEFLDGSGRRHPIVGDRLQLGRHSDNEVRLADSSISRHHAEIRRGGDGRFTITDLDSMNGVYVNDRRIKTATLEDGDLIELGDIGLRFSAGGDEAESDDQTLLLKTEAMERPSGEDSYRT